MPTATIKLFLTKGDAKRLRTAELSNWSGKALASPRTELDDLFAREETASTGVYFLIGVDASSGNQSIYIGEAESVKDRLRSHLSKDFWNHVVFFISKDDNLTKAHIRYLEGRLIEQARLAARVEVKNGQASGSKLPESDREDMEVFLGRIHQLLPVMGVEALLPTGGTEAQRAEEEELICEIKGLHAEGRLTPSGLVVLANSQAVLIERASANQYPNTTKARNELIDAGVLIRHDDHFSFAKDVEFSSPSAAAAVIHGGSANGLTAWKNKRGKSLKELEEEEIGS